MLNLYWDARYLTSYLRKLGKKKSVRNLKSTSGIRNMQGGLHAKD